MLARRLVAGVRRASAAGMAGAGMAGAGMAGAGVAIAAVAMACVAVSVPSAAAAATSASTLYHDALATTRAWSVHYASSSTSSKETLVESGDAGPASASQTVTMGKGTISILVIGGFTYVKGNAAGLETLAGLSSSQASEAAGQWIEFATSNTAFAPVVQGVRSQDIAKELALTTPLSLGRARTIDGQKVEAIEGTQKFGSKTQHVVLYVRTKGTHVPVEEDSVDAQGKRTATEHIAYSKWGERIRPSAPKATISIGSISAV